MDRALIERMVGAVVLVLLLVVVAPALLDGRRDSDGDGRDSDPDESIRTEVIVLNSRSVQPEKELPPADEKPVELPVVPAARPIEPEPAPVEATKPARPQAAVQAPEGYAVQIGSFSRKDNADKFAAGLSKEGFAVFVMSAKTTAGTVYRVNAGPRATRADAEKLASVIAKSGRSAMVVELESGSNGGSQ